MKKYNSKINLTRKEELNLKDKKDKELKPHIKIRYEAILLRNKDISVKDIVKILDVREKAIYSWIKQFLSKTDNLFKDKKGRGRPPLVDFEETWDKSSLYLETHSLNETINYISRLNNGEYVSKREYKKFLKKKDIPTKEQEDL